MKKSKRKMLFLCGAALAAAAAVIGLRAMSERDDKAIYEYNDDEDDWKEDEVEEVTESDNIHADFEKEENENSENCGDYVFTIDGQPVSSEEYGMFIRLLRASGVELSDDDLLKRFIRQRAIDMEAKRRGICVTQEEIDEYNKARFDALAKDEAAREIVEKNVSNAGMTMEEYCKECGIIAEHEIISSKLKTTLEAIYNKRGISDMTAEEYYNGYIDGIASSMKINKA